MLNYSETGLQIFERLQIDHKLPKYKRQKEAIENVIVTNSDVVFRADGELLVEQTTGSFGPRISRKVKSNILIKLWQWIISLFSRKDKTMSVINFFACISDEAQNINLLEERAKGYELAIVNATKSGQIALIEKLQDGLDSYVAETRMLTIGITKFVSEKTVVEFYKKSEKGVRLDYLKNFIRNIPDNLVELKCRADNLEIFDNYVVMHYDPDSKSYAETQEDIAKRQDPILFGVLKGRTDLYFIGDWIDEFCDLTLDQMAEVLGKEAAEEIG